MGVSRQPQAQPDSADVIVDSNSSAGGETGASRSPLWLTKVSTWGPSLPTKSIPFLVSGWTALGFSVFDGILIPKDAICPFNDPQMTENPAKSW